ncbi:unnamed protein product [Meloidogyne enterolobii]|uniref:Uncharacterized protein n=1 Tax=Meloidogyne enterolobii TaxID=390850 RepID=A0ACB0YEC0_MELEN
MHFSIYQVPQIPPLILSRVNMKSPKCKNCGAEHASLYRRDQTNGDCYCNACGLYRKLHGMNKCIINLLAIMLSFFTDRLSIL